MNRPHLTVYYDPDHDARDNRGFCVDLDHPDNIDGTRAPGDDGRRFVTPAAAADFVLQWLYKQGGSPPELYPDVSE
jgi:hypothetical protein